MAETSSMIKVAPAAPERAVARRPSFTLLASEDLSPLVLRTAFVLAACAGCTNAAAMLGAFSAPGIGATGVTHVTGSLTKMGMVVADHDRAHSAPALAILGYVSGAAAAGASAPPGLLDLDRLRDYAAILFATALLLAGAAGLQELDHGHGFGFLPVVAAAAACGAQNGLATAATSSIVRTTHMTGMATDVGLILGRAAGRLRRGDRGPDGARPGLTGPELCRLGLYGRLALGFVGGAAVGSALVDKLELKYARALYAPAAVVFAVAAAAAAMGGGRASAGGDVELPARAADAAIEEAGEQKSEQV